MLDSLTKFITAICFKLVGSIESGSYWGIALLMAIESTVIPLPSELVMIPAGYLAYDGRMSMTWAIVAGIVGSIGGSLINYYVSMKFGRPIFDKYGKYVFIKPHTMDKLDRIFAEYGDIVTFSCRLVPGLRHLISIPAGLTRMPLPKFIFYTGLGAGIWCAILTFFGYWLGSKREVWQDVWTQYSGNIILICVGIIVLFGAVYWWFKRVPGDKIARNAS